MPKKTIAEFKVEYMQILDDKGNCDKKLMPKLSKDQIKEMYKNMVLSRIFDEKLLALQRQGRIGTFAQVKGQEACQVGACTALEKEDWMFPAFRETAAFITMGAGMEGIIRYNAGDEWGNYIPPGVNCFTTNVPVGSQLLHATGFAMGMKKQGKKGAVITFFGDGATSEGEFHEALNFGGVFKAPVVYICQNNQYAISLHVSKQTASKTLAQKGIAYGLPCIQVDGNDVFAVYAAVKEALQRAKQGKGPTMIECYTYRLGDHTTSDDAKRYRSEEEVERWKKKDPIPRLKKYMETKGFWDKNAEEKLMQYAEKIVNAAVEKAEAVPKAPIEDIFKYQYAEMTDELKEQLEYLKKFEK